MFDLIFTRTHDLLLRMRRADTRAKPRSVHYRVFTLASSRLSTMLGTMKTCVIYFCIRLRAHRFKFKVAEQIYVLPLKLMCVVYIHTNSDTIQYTQNTALFILLYS